MGPRHPPAQVVGVAVFASSDFGTLGVVVRVLVEGDGARRVPVAEDVSAAATVVFAREEAEVEVAGSVVADGGFGVGLHRRD